MPLATFILSNVEITIKLDEEVLLVEPLFLNLARIDKVNGPLEAISQIRGYVENIL